MTTKWEHHKMRETNATTNNSNNLVTTGQGQNEMGNTDADINNSNDL